MSIRNKLQQDINAFRADMDSMGSSPLNSNGGNLLGKDPRQLGHASASNLLVPEHDLSSPSNLTSAGKTHLELGLDDTLGPDQSIHRQADLSPVEVAARHGAEWQSGSEGKAEQRDPFDMQSVRGLSEADMTTLTTANTKAREILTALGEDPQMMTKLETAFGKDFDPKQAKALIRDLANGTGGPTFEVLSREQLKAKGAYGNNTIFLSNDLLTNNADNPDAVTNVVLEELGHNIDQKLNRRDIAGDEGAIFAKMARGETISSSELKALKQEDDHAQIILGHKTIDVENFGFSSIKNKFSDVKNAISKKIDSAKNKTSKALKNSGASQSIVKSKGSSLKASNSRHRAKRSSIFKPIPDPINKFVKDKGSDLKDWATDKGSDLKDKGSALKDKGSDIKDWATDKGSDLKDKGGDLKDKGSDIKDWATDKGSALKDKGSDLKDWATDKGSDLKDKGSDLKDKGSDLKDKGSDLKDKGSDFKDKGSDIKDWATDKGSALKDKGSDIKDWATDKGSDLKDKGSDIKDWATDKGSDLKDKGSDLKDWATDKGSDLKDKGSDLKDKGSDIKDWATDKGNDLKDKGGDIKDWATDKGNDLKDKGGDIKDWATDKGNDLKDKGGDLKDWTTDKGSDLIDKGGDLKEPADITSQPQNDQQLPIKIEQYTAKVEVGATRVSGGQEQTFQVEHQADGTRFLTLEQQGSIGTGVGGSAGAMVHEKGNFHGAEAKIAAFSGKGNRFEIPQGMTTKEFIRQNWGMFDPADIIAPRLPAVKIPTRFGTLSTPEIHLDLLSDPPSRVRTSHTGGLKENVGVESVNTISQNSAQTEAILPKILGDNLGIDISGDLAVTVHDYDHTNLQGYELSVSAEGNARIQDHNNNSVLGLDIDESRQVDSSIEVVRNTQSQKIEEIRMNQGISWDDQRQENHLTWDMEDGSAANQAWNDLMSGEGTVSDFIAEASVDSERYQEEKTEDFSLKASAVVADVNIDFEVTTLTETG